MDRLACNLSPSSSRCQHADRMTPAHHDTIRLCFNPVSKTWFPRRRGKLCLHRTSHGGPPRVSSGSEARADDVGDKKLTTASVERGKRLANCATKRDSAVAGRLSLQLLKNSKNPADKLSPAGTGLI